MTPILKSVKRSKNAAVDNEEGRDEINSSHKNPVETVVDPSFSSQTNTKLHAMPKRIAKTKIKKKEAEKDTLGRFTDSRGSGLRLSLLFLVAHVTTSLILIQVREQKRDS